jgi:hypothetical protein
MRLMVIFEWLIVVIWASTLASRESIPLTLPTNHKVLFFEKHVRAM